MVSSLAVHRVGARIQNTTRALGNGSVRTCPFVSGKEVTVAAIFRALTPAVSASNVEAESKSGGRRRRKRGKRRGGRRGGRRGSRT